MNEIYFNQLIPLKDQALKDKIIELLSSKLITVDELVNEKRLNIPGFIFNVIGCMYSQNTPPLVLNHDNAWKLFIQAHNKNDVYGSFNTGLYYYDHAYSPAIREYRSSKNKTEEQENLNYAKKYKQDVIYYLTAAKDRGYPNKLDIDKFLIEIGTNFFDMGEHQEADSAFRVLEEGANLTYYKAAIAYEQGKTDEIIKLMSDGFNKPYAEALYQKLFSVNDTDGNYNKLIKTLIDKIENTATTLIKIIEIAKGQNNQFVIETLLEYGLDLSKLGLTHANEVKDFLDLSPIVKQYEPIQLSILMTYKLEELTIKSVADLEKLKEEIIGKPNRLFTKNRVQYLKKINYIIALKKLPEEYPIELKEMKATGNASPKNTLVQYYLYVDHNLIVLPVGKNQVEIINKLITTLLYEARRHSFVSEQCQSIKKIIGLLDNRLQNYSEKEFQDLIDRRETRGHTFFGEELSDDSDDGLTPNEQIDQASLMFQTQKVEKLGISWVKTGLKSLTLFSAKQSYQNREEQLLPERKTLSDGETLYQDFNARAMIPYEQLDQTFFEQAKKDLIVLNRYLKNGKPINEALNKVTTKFLVAQYRGVTYLASKWNSRSRKLHRKTDEVKMPSFSNSVYHAAQFNVFTEFNADKYKSKETQTILKIIAEKLESMLIAMRLTGEYKNHNNGYTYDNLAELIQDLYSKDYAQFHQAISGNSPLKVSKVQGPLWINDDKPFEKNLLNDKNPFVSTGDRPYHALRYAYGTKPYAGNEGERLRPRWNKTGRAERPYSGKVYISLHPLTDYDSKGPMHVVSLIDQGKINVMNNIVAERETSFPAYIKGDRVMYQHIAKYPSFSQDYHPRFLEKYGLDPVLYNLFREAFNKYPPHSYENRYLKKILGNWLCAYQERKLIEIAFYKAIENGGVLIYKNKENTYGFTLPDFGVPNVQPDGKLTEDIKMKIRSEEKREIKKEIELSRRYRRT